MKNLYIIILITSILGISASFVIAENYYKWTDEDGVIHVTDNPEKVPPRFRTTTKVVKEKETGKEAAIKKYKKLLRNNKQTLIYGAAGLFGLLLLYKLINSLRNNADTSAASKYNEYLRKSGIDTMNIPQFKSYIKNVLSVKGYSVKEFEGDLDFGVDFIAEKKDVVYLVKVISDSMSTSKMVVNDVLRDTVKYGCNRALLISKNFFDEDAQKFANSSPSELIDRNGLGKWIKETKLYS